MNRALKIWIGGVLALIAAAFVASIFLSDNYVGGPLLAAVFAAAAWRTWSLAGAPKSPGIQR